MNCLSDLFKEVGQLNEQEWAVFSCPTEDVSERRYSALRQMLSAFARLIWILLVTLCSTVGIMTLYQLRGMARFFVRYEYRLRRAALQHRIRVRRALLAQLRHILEPLGQFLTIFSYLRSVRAAPRDARIPLRTVIWVVLGKLFYVLKRFFISVFNIAAPVAAVCFLVSTIQNNSREGYGLQVYYNDVFLGIVRSESQYDKALRLMNERITDGSRPEAEVTFSLVQTSYYTDPQLMAEQMIRLSGLDLFEGYGLYVDGSFLGALEDADPLLDNLSARLDASRTGALGEVVSFNHAFALREGLYPTSSKRDLESIISRFDLQLSAEKTYTIQEGDTPIGIAELNGISIEELERLNPGIFDSLPVGETLTIAHSVPFLRVLSERTEVTFEDIAYGTKSITDEDELLGYFRVEEEGVVGTRRVTNRVTYLGSEILRSEIVNSEIIEEPQPRTIVVGSRRPEASASGYDTTDDIIDSIDGEMYIWPVDGGRVSMPIWGYAGHTGNDIANIPAGTTIRAAASGVVIYAGYTAWGYGRHIIIQHANGDQTLYAHNSANYVAVGDEVAQGQAIAAVGSTGNSSGNHLHFEIRRGDQYIDSRLYIGSVCPR